MAPRAKVYAMGYWRSQTCDNSLGAMPSTFSTKWGRLEWKQDMATGNFTKVDILDSSNTALIVDLNGSTLDGISYFLDLNQYGEIGDTQDIKIRIRLYRLTGNCRVYDIYLNRKVKGMVATNSLAKEVRDWLASQIASGGTATVAAPNRFFFGSGNTTPVVTDTSMDTELKNEALSATPTVGTRQVTFEGELGTGEQNSNTLQEGGIGDNSSDKTLYGRFIHTAISKDNSKTVNYQFTISIDVE